MMIRNIIVGCFCLMLLIPGAVNAQKKRTLGSMKKPFVLSQQFKHAAGAGVSMYSLDDSQELIYQLSYQPTLSLTRSHSDFSFSIGSQISGGYHPETDADTLSYIFADLPLLAEFNFGHNASKDFYSDAGWFLGGGYAWQLFRENWQSGPVATLGVRAFFFGPSLTVRYHRFFAITDEARSLNTITVALNLGGYFEQVKLNNKVSRFSNGFRK